ncbi:MAG: PTS system mannose/fructose/sorbose family transporter subunit IID [Desulfuromonadales bacterium]
MQDTKLKALSLLRIYLRSFLLQASWNFEKLQNLGFLYMMLPGLRSIYGENIPTEVLRHQGSYFNTHPYFAPLIAGTVLHLEARKLVDEDLPVDSETYKNMVMAPFAAMGDALFWGGVRPLAALVGLLVASQGSLWAPVVFLILFNLPHLLLRGGGLILGYMQELRAIETVQKCRLPDLAIRLKESSTVLIGVLCAYLSFKGCEHQSLSAVWGFVLLPVVLLFAWLAHKGVSSLLLVLLTTFSLLFMALLF